MVDADFNVQLLEANVSPACADALVAQFGEDFVHTVLDPQFPPAAEYLVKLDTQSSNCLCFIFLF
jgi:hypothetical protein